MKILVAEDFRLMALMLKKNPAQLGYHADDYLLKPVRQEMLETRLKGLLGQALSNDSNQAESVLPEPNQAEPAGAELVREASN